MNTLHTYVSVHCVVCANDIDLNESIIYAKVFIDLNKHSTCVKVYIEYKVVVVRH